MPRGVARNGFKLTKGRIKAGILTPHLAAIAAELAESRGMVKRYGIDIVKKALEEMGTQPVQVATVAATAIPFQTSGKQKQKGPQKGYQKVSQRGHLKASQKQGRRKAA